MSAIIAGVDGSVHSQRALEWAVQEGALRQVPVTVITVCSGHRDWFSKPPGNADRERWHAMAQEQADKALIELGDVRPPSVTVRAVHGDPAEELMNAADDGDTIVVAARGSGGFSRLRLGSVSTYLTHRANNPVVIIPPDDVHR